MARKSSQLQIRVTPQQKSLLKRLAREASLDVSTWVLRRLLPEETERFQALTAALARPDRNPLALAELADYLRALPAEAFQRAVAHAPRATLDPHTLNYLAGTIELAAARRGQAPPHWTRDVPVPPEPQFGSALRGLRLYLLTRSPVALRRRNLFVDASIDDRI